MSRFAFNPSRAARLALVLLAIAGLGLTSCVAAPAPTPDVEELANAIAAVWATQTAQAASSVAATPAGETPAGVAAATAAATAAITPASTTAPVATMAATAPSPTDVAAATSTPTPSPAPTATPAPTLTFAPTGTARPVAAGTPACEITIDAELTAAWRWETLGCPVAEAETVWAAWEPFQRGYMFWRNDEDAIYALPFANGSDSTQGPVLAGGDTWRWDNSNPEGRGLTPPAGSFEPVRGFGRVWFEFLGGPEGQLGWATGPERGICVTLQFLESGFIFRSDSTLQTCQDNFMNMAIEPSFTPVLVSIQEDAWWRLH